MERLALFPTPVVTFDIAGHEEVHAELTERLVAEARTTPGVQRSNVGGWHSVPDLAQRQDECYQAVVRTIVEHVGLVTRELAEAVGGPPLPPARFAAHAWAMVMGDGDYTIVHEHGDSHWSSAYYVDAGDADRALFPDSGALALLDPRRSGRTVAGLDLTGTVFSLRPRAGLLVIFPGWLQHFVNPYRGRRPRITISCNVSLSPAP